MIRRITALACTVVLAGCQPAPPATAGGGASSPDTAASAAPAAAQPASTAKTAASSSQLRLTLDGKPWRADREFFGAYHPPGLDRAVLMAASFGPKDKNEQVFNLNLTGVGGPGRYVASGNTLSLKGITSSAIQLANLSEQRYLVGGPLGYEIEIELLQAGADVIEARFSGTMNASDGGTLRVSDGYFLWRE
ncbi:hypothetical protein [Tahibacter harae]|uniref:Uncharacterized protein n=1 Tax=Tahibacter harae TaxID=2963937 RepID=A0ABT1QMQ6_9GAMM|nr:hypothetical protein [Tahibacter harae]MCQ4163808.1 hypothetical protein [Tahibacter harae]